MYIIFKMFHSDNRNTREKKDSTIKTKLLRNTEVNIISNINNLKEDVNSLNSVFIKRLQEGKNNYVNHVHIWRKR